MFQSLLVVALGVSSLYIMISCRGKTFLVYPAYVLSWMYRHKVFFSALSVVEMIGLRVYVQPNNGLNQY